MLSRIAAHAMSYLSAMRPHALTTAPEQIEAATTPHELPSTEVSLRHLYPMHIYSLPNQMHATREVWTSVAGLSARDEVLNLRATPSASSWLSDGAMAAPIVWTTTWTLRPGDDLRTFLESGHFDHVTTMRIAHPDPSCLVLFIGHVEAHPREDMMLHLLCGATLNVVTAARISALTLAGVRVDYAAGQVDPEVLTVLRRCPFPVELRGSFSPDTLSIASQIPTLRRLEMTEHGQPTSEHVLPDVTRHPSLERLRFSDLEFSRLPNEATWTLRDSGTDRGSGGGGEYEDESTMPLSASEHRSKL